jgi:hypothetical protein
VYSDAIVKLFKAQGKKAGQISEHYPKNIGLSLSANAYDYEFLICGRNVPYTQNQIVNFFIEHGAMLQTVDSSINAYENKFVTTICCNLEHADLGPMEFAIQLQGMKFVSSAEYSEMRGRLFGRLAGIAFNSKRRAVALESATLFNLGQRLAKETGASGSAALYQEGREYAHRIVDQIAQILTTSQQLGHSLYFDSDDEEDLSEPRLEAYCMKCRMKREIRHPRQVLLSNKSQALQGTCAVCTTRVFKIGAKHYGKVRGGPVIENAQAFLMAAGWGIFELRTATEGRFGSVTISDPPTMDGDVPYGNQFAEGIAAGVLEKASGNSNRMVLIGEKYDRYNQTLTLHFSEQIPTKVSKHSPIPAPNVKKILNKKQPEIAEWAVPKAISPVTQEVIEVDRIIRSLEKIESDARTSIGQNEDQMEQGKKTTPDPLIVEPIASSKPSVEKN